MRMAIIVGHNKQAQGAEGAAPISRSEFLFNSEVAEIMVELSSQVGLEAKIFNRVKSTSTKKEIEAVYKKTDDWNADVTIELHFNAFNQIVKGTETLSGPSSLSLQTATAVHKRLIQLYDRGISGDRGIKPYRPGIRGGLSLISGRAPAILVEPFFGDNPDEAELAMTKGLEALAHAYVSGIAEIWQSRGDMLVASNRRRSAPPSNAHIS